MLSESPAARSAMFRKSLRFTPLALSLTRPLSLGFAAILLVALPVTAQVSVTTQHNNRAGQHEHWRNPLDASNVNQKTFGKNSFNRSTATFTPSRAPQVAIPNGTHNVVYVVTERTAYAFDATPIPARTAHSGESFIDQRTTSSVSSGDVGCGDLNPEVGITGTPVIDPSPRPSTSSPKQGRMEPSSAAACARRHHRAQRAPARRD